MSVFLELPQSAWVVENEHAFAIRDAHPVTNGHTLVITKELVPTWFDANSEQRQGLMELVGQVRDQLYEELGISDFNIGINVGPAAGQTVDHLHIHVIPRSPGDVSDPRGGVRNVISSKANYLSNRSELITPRNGNFRKSLLAHLNDPEVDQVDLNVAFVMRSGLEIIRESLERALQRGAHVRLLTTDYLMTTDPSALGLLLDIRETEEFGENLDVRIFSDQSTSFHPKAYLFRSSKAGRRIAFVGSSNLSWSALNRGVEWNLYREDVDELWLEFQVLWDDHRSIPISREWVSVYSDKREAARATNLPTTDEVPANEATESAPKPWSVQQEALDALAETRIDGHQAGLVVMATGLGKTWLAAFDSSRPNFKRVLFIAHRIEILKAARDVFRKVRVSDELTFFVGESKDASGDVVFAGVQLLHQNLDGFAPDTFDYIVVDEFHHATAPTYRDVISHFKPKFLLGLTATPDRSDNADLLALCHDNLVYECGLIQGLHRDLLSPFKYRAIMDVANYEHIPWKSGKFQVEDLTNNLATQERAQQVFEEWLNLGGPNRRTLAFCCSQTHADFMKDFFIQKKFHAASVHSGPSSDLRADALADLEGGALPILFSVDLFNEGVDIPAIDCVLMLRPTESNIVFFQQLGRGLRKSNDKEFLDVIDLVGNHHSFLTKMRLLAKLGNSKTVGTKAAIEAVENQTLELPEGCSITVETEVIDLMKVLAGKIKKGVALQEALASWLADHDDERPSALQFALYLGKDLQIPKKQGGWFGFLNTEGLLLDPQTAALANASDWFSYLERGSYSKSFKLVTILAFCNLGGFEKPVDLAVLMDACRQRIYGDPRLLSDLEDATSFFANVLNPTEQEWLKYWTVNPISALTKMQSDGLAWMKVDNDLLSFEPSVPSSIVSSLSAMTQELCEYKLHRYLKGRRVARMYPRLVVHDDDGTELDAGFRVESLLGLPIAVFIEAAGAGFNRDYVSGLDRILHRLAALNTRVTDAYVDSSRVRDLPLSKRRLIDLPAEGFIDLSQDDPTKLRKDILKRMPSIGQDTNAKKGGGNPRKAMKIVIDGISPLSAESFSEFLVTGDESGSQSDATSTNAS